MSSSPYPGTPKFKTSYFLLSMSESKIPTKVFSTLSADRVENTFVGIFDSLIDNKKYEVLNFGVPGYGLEDIELFLKEEVLSFKPDYLFLMTYNGNDYMDALQGIHR